MTKQEENWELMTTLQIPWSEANKITDEEDRKFLLDRATEIKSLMMRQAQQEQVQSSIITPTLL
jgi:hypothetical protein